jgi:hypothetical protein
MSIADSFHGSIYEDYCLQGCGVMYSGIYLFICSSFNYSASKSDPTYIFVCEYDGK